MGYFTEQAPTSTECLQMIRTKYGDKAKVLLERTIRKGGLFGIGGREEVEMTGTYSYAPGPAIKNFDLESAKREVLAAAGNTAAGNIAAGSSAAGTSAAGNSAMPPVRSDPAIQQMLKELRSLSEKVDSRLAPLGTVETTEHPVLLRLEEDLNLNDFSFSYTRKILDRVRKEFSLKDLDDYEMVQRQVVDWIGEGLRIYGEAEIRKKPRVVVLVGPTGVGKTTTIAKLAALYGERFENRWKHPVRLVTLDLYRISGKQQIETYGEIMELPVSLVETYEDLRQVMALYRTDVDYILVDTIGRSPRNYQELAKMKETLDACGTRAEIHVCLAASTKAGDIKEILKQFEPFKYRSVIITKLDETGRVGNIISALEEEGKSVSFVTDGQTVPTNIARASVTRFLLNLEGFVIDRTRLEKKFGPVTPSAGRATERGE